MLCGGGSVRLEGMRRLMWFLGEGCIGCVAAREESCGFDVRG